MLDAQPHRVSAQPAGARDRGCPSCGNPQHAVLAGPSRLLRLPATHAVVRCTRCGLLRLHPGRSDHEVADFHEEADSYSPESYEVWGQLRLPFFDHNLDRIEAVLGPPAGRLLLDFGCAAGHFLGSAAARGWTPVGVEVSSRLGRLAASRFGCPVHASLDEVRAAVGAVDVIHASHVLEHVADPAETLGELFGLLRPGGVLVFEVPHQFGSWQDRGKLALFRVLGASRAESIVRPPVDSLHHTFFYTPEVLAALLVRSGFHILQFSTVNPVYYRSGLIGWPRRALYRVLDHAAARVGRGPVIGGMVQRPFERAPGSAHPAGNGRPR